MKEGDRGAGEKIEEEGTGVAGVAPVFEGVAVGDGGSGAGPWAASGHGVSPLLRSGSSLTPTTGFLVGEDDRT
ncbi:MAG: hypothetical protein HYU86_05335 [Chloroflexi bacterium]|nr:hypothetical protein [Chloroflexota bacterium]